MLKSVTVRRLEGARPIQAHEAREQPVCACGERYTAAVIEATGERLCLSCLGKRLRAVERGE